MTAAGMMFAPIWGTAAFERTDFGAAPPPPWGLEVLLEAPLEAVFLASLEMNIAAFELTGTALERVVCEKWVAELACVS